MTRRETMVKWVNRICVTIFAAAVLISLYIMARGIGTEGKDYGPGAYYYTDIPGWEEIFYPHLVQD